MDYQQLLGLVGLALTIQRYRPVELDSLVAGRISLPSGPDANVDPTLANVSSDPNWVEITRQLSQLKVAGLASVWIRRDKSDCEFVCIYGWNGVLSFDTFKEHADYVWDVTRRLGHDLGKFDLVGENLQRLVEAATEKDGAAPPTKDDSPAGGGAPEGQIPAGQAPDGQIPPGEDKGPVGPQSGTGGQRAARILRTIVDLHYAASPTTAMIGVGIGGLQQDLVDGVQRLFGNPILREDNWSFRLKPASMGGGVIDATDLSVHGQTQVGSLGLPQLSRNIEFLAKNG